MCNYKLTVTLEKSVDVVDGGGWVTGMTWRKAVILEAGERASVLALRDLAQPIQARHGRSRIHAVGPLLRNVQPPVLAVGIGFGAQHLRQ